MTEKFLPYRALIDQFGAGGFRFGGYSHHGGLSVLPSGMRAFDRQTIDEITPLDLQSFLFEKSEIDLLLIGSGASIRALALPAQDHLRAAGINFDVMTTSAAVSIYNVVLAEERRVAAILLPVERPVER